LLIGINGSGKSTLLDALTFVLFGKPFRNINKPLVVNSVNRKDCLAEVEFSTNGHRYLVRRGIKPSIFQIICDGLLLNQDSDSKDYQDHLEKFVLKMNYKSATQIMILGSANYKPFMAITPADRRVIIEDLLDIQIFSVMNVIVRQKLSFVKDQLEKNKLAIVGKEERIVYVQKIINSLNANNDEKLSVLHINKVKYLADVLAYETAIASNNNEMNRLLTSTKTIDKIKKKYRSLVDIQSKINANHQMHVKELKFFASSDDCPTCKQEIEKEFKIVIIGDLTGKVEEYSNGLKDINVKIDDTVDQITKLENDLKTVNKLRIQISTSQVKLDAIREALSETENNIANLSISDTTLIESEKEYDLIMVDIKALIKQREDLLAERLVIETSINLLKDGGVKTKIVRQYLPIINKLINSYLYQMGFCVDFNIGENFEETIKSRYRDEFSYESFSEGEKSRIDLAVLFTWREIARLRNSVHTNILIFDEIFDGSLDSNGTGEFRKLISEMDKVNLFVISHKSDMISDQFRDVYKFEKRRNFSVMSHLGT
jgi:DNA repair exonuclease SbcCD ATPase subunit